jgi:hypothetical protein
MLEQFTHRVVCELRTRGQVIKNHFVSQVVHGPVLRKVLRSRKVDNFGTVLVSVEFMSDFHTYPRKKAQFFYKAE